MRSVCTLLTFILWVSLIFGQETPPILNFSSSDYNAENQNWDVNQDDNNFIYVANNEGLLQYNGEDWSIYKSPNQTIPRSVLAVSDRIYYGAYMEFGYYSDLDNDGVLDYNSLSRLIEDQLLEDENIWHIKEFNGFILFQSYDRIYFYNPNNDSIEFITDKNNFYRLFKTSNNLYVFKRDGHLVKIEDGAEVKIASFDNSEDVQFVLELYEDENGLVMLTRNNGFYRVNGNSIEKWNIGINEQLRNYKIFCGIRLKNKSWVLGTISNGLIFIGPNGELSQTINIKNGLSNNTVLNLFEDKEGNLWVALDNGIDCINLQSFVSEFNDFNGTVGTVYTSIIHNNNLFLGTNQGLFYRDKESKESLNLVEGTQGQVWSLFEYDGDLLCGHTDGTFIVKNGRAEKIGTTFGTWGFREIPGQNKTLLLGNYSGMGILRKVSDNWVDGGQIEGFSNSARFFEITDNLDVYVNHEYKGVYKLNLNSDLSQFNSVKNLGNASNGKGSGLLKIQDEIYYKNITATYKIENEEFIKDNSLSELTSESNYLSGKIIADETGKIWSFNRNSIAFAQKGLLNDKLDIKRIPIDNNKKKTTVSFENIDHLKDQAYLLGRTNGYIKIDLDYLDEEKQSRVFLNRIALSSSVNNNEISVSRSDKNPFKHNLNSLHFRFSVPNYDKYDDVKYQYKLTGLMADWSNWQSNSNANFEKLPHGDYEFAVRAKIGNVLSDNVEHFNFNIRPPFHLSTLAIIIYIAGIALLLFLTHQASKRYYRRVHEKSVEENIRSIELERVRNEQKMIRLKNQKLNQEIEAKNREVAISMMSVIKRNEVLKSLKKELDNNEAINDNDPIYRLIKKNTDSDKDWEFFKNAFDQADVDFLKRAKEQHPKLTANDLKFCAYLRLNLSSKEIAPLLNISVKSVEVRRYRLRKKLNLEHKDNLTDYILSI